MRMAELHGTFEGGAGSPHGVVLWEDLRGGTNECIEGEGAEEAVSIGNEASVKLIRLRTAGGVTAGALGSVAEPEPVGAGTFWSEPEPVLRSGSGSTLYKTDEVLNDILFVTFHIDKRLFKKRILINK